MAPISQREARRLMKRVAALERQIHNQRDRWSGDYIGTEIASVNLESLPAQLSAMKTARKLKHAVVAVTNDSNTVRFVALPHPSEDV